MDTTSCPAIIEMFFVWFSSLLLRGFPEGDNGSFKRGGFRGSSPMGRQNEGEFKTVMVCMVSFETVNFIFGRVPMNREKPRGGLQGNLPRRHDV